MFDWLKFLLDTSNFPQRWFCGEWSQWLGWTHIVADLATFGAYMMIPFVMVFFIKRRGMRFPTVFYLFAAFIFSCGIVHLIEASIFWQPWYRLSGLFKVMTALVSWATVIAIIPIFPQLLALRKPGDLIRAEERFRILLESAPDAMIIVDADGLVSRVNKQTEVIFGYQRDELVGKTVELLIPGYLQEGEGEASRFSTEMVKRKDLFGTRKNRQNFPVEISLSPIEIANETCFCAAVRDVSDKQQAQEKLLRSERLSAVGEAMTGLVHESRNALARSQAALKLLERQVDDQPEAKRFISEALQAQKDVQRLFEEVRQYAAPVTKKPETCDISALVNNAWENLKSVSLDKELFLREVNSEKISTICEVDPFSVSGAIRNLLENSLAACDDRRLEITITYHPSQLNGGKALEIRFSDNGTGTTSDLEEIFTAFFTTKVQGTGLGLAIARRTIEEYGGRLYAHRPESGKLEFVMIIPQKNR